MSTILKALKRLESERQSVTGGGNKALPLPESRFISEKNPKRGDWWVVLGVIVIAILAVILYHYITKAKKSQSSTLSKKPSHSRPIDSQVSKNNTGPVISTSVLKDTQKRNKVSSSEVSVESPLSSPMQDSTASQPQVMDTAKPDSPPNSISMPKENTQMPDLQLQGLVYSKEPKERMVIINQKTLREGDTFQGIRVKQIQKDSVLLQKNATTWRIHY